MNDIPYPDGDPRALFFVSLGGAGEIGMNLNLYGYAGDWLMLDCGVTFGDDSQPGLEVVMPDPAFIVERRDRLLGIVATHAHEDHIGAIPYLWTQLHCPVWATPFTASLLRAKLVEAGIADKVRINIVPMSGRFTIGPFDLELITLTHSIPEPNAVALRTPVGMVLHTGDWKFDPDPLIGEIYDEAALHRLGDEGVLAMIGDSTNALHGSLSPALLPTWRASKRLRAPPPPMTARSLWSGGRCGGSTRPPARTAISPICHAF
jgi:ribonuclease J